MADCFQWNPVGPAKRGNSKQYEIAENGIIGANESATTKDQQQNGREHPEGATFFEGQDLEVVGRQVVPTTDVAINSAEKEYICVNNQKIYRLCRTPEVDRLLNDKGTKDSFQADKYRETNGRSVFLDDKEKLRIHIRNETAQSGSERVDRMVDRLDLDEERRQEADSSPSEPDKEEPQRDSASLNRYIKWNCRTKAIFLSKRHLYRGTRRKKNVV